MFNDSVKDRSTPENASVVALEPTNGHVIAGVWLDQHRFLGRVRAAQLSQIAPDPRTSEDARHVDHSREMQDLRAVREEVQRLFVNEKKRNVLSYAQYICRLFEDDDGILPAITLYSSRQLEVHMLPSGSAFIQVPWSIRFVAIDGETQLAARYEAANINPETAQAFVPVYINHGLGLAWARQAFHDLNTLAVRPNVALSLGMDARDTMTRIARALEKTLPFFTDRINKVSRQLKANDPHVLSLPTLRNACTTLLLGINGVRWGARPVPMDQSKLPVVERAAKEWFARLTAEFGPMFENRQEFLVSAPAVMAALGALGHPLVAIEDDEARRNKAEAFISTLKPVKWQRGEHWAGIAGKMTARGQFSVGGAKETAYAVYGALTDPHQEAYRRVRISCP